MILVAMVFGVASLGQLARGRTEGLDWAAWRNSMSTDDESTP